MVYLNTTNYSTKLGKEAITNNLNHGDKLMHKKYHDINITQAS